MRKYLTVSANWWKLKLIAGKTDGECTAALLTLVKASKSPRANERNANPLKPDLQPRNHLSGLFVHRLPRIISCGLSDEETMQRKKFIFYNQRWTREGRGLPCIIWVKGSAVGWGSHLRVIKKCLSVLSYPGAFFQIAEWRTCTLSDPPLQMAGYIQEPIVDRERKPTTVCRINRGQVKACGFGWRLGDLVNSQPASSETNYAVPEDSNNR